MTSGRLATSKSKTSTVSNNKNCLVLLANPTHLSNTDVINSFRSDRHERAGAEFRECFYLFARSGQITTLDELTVIMRSLGLSPTIQELTAYLKRSKAGKMSFADFLDVMHQHSKVEALPDEVVAAFRAADTAGRGTLPARQLRHLLQNWGEGLSVREVDNIFREANVSNGGQVRYSDFVKIACAPVPDYY